MRSHLEKARRGDSLAKKFLVKTLTTRLARMATYYARRVGLDPDDLLQDAWLGLLEALPRLDITIGEPEQFLLRHARWRLLDSIKRARTPKTAYLEEVAFPEAAGGHRPDLLAPLCATQLAQSLSPTQRLVLSQLMAGRTWREAGANLGCSSANIAYHVRQIRRQYERIMEEAAL